MRNKIIVAIALAALPALGGCVHHQTADAAHPEARAYLVTGHAEADVDAALARAKAANKRVLLVMGANWCHDSRALAGWLESARFKPMIAQNYELVYVNVGLPQTKDGHNLQIARRFGIETFDGTPALLVLDGDGTLINRETAMSWRNAASRSEDDIFATLVALAKKPAEPAAKGG